MMAGRLAPRYQSMALLYPRSKVLQSSLFEYFIVVVQLCHQLLKFTQKSVLTQFTSTLSDTALKSYSSNLDRWANAIKEEVNILTTEEVHKSSRLAALSIKFSESASFQHKFTSKLQVLDACSKYDHKTTWKQTRQRGNATLHNQTPKYREWKGYSESSTLLFTGKLGSGKSVLLANIVEDLYRPRDTNIPVVYFFCRHDILESLQARTVIGSLARQMLQQMIDLDISAQVLEMSSSLTSLEEILSLLQQVLPSSYKAFIVVDGLDDCDNTEQTLLVKFLQEMQKNFIIHLCISERLEASNALTLGSKNFSSATIILIPEENPDIESFITTELEQCIESEKLVLGDPILIVEIQDALLERSQGMFLWVALQIISLCDMKTDYAIRQALADLPKDLSQTFHRILRKSEGLETYQRRILELIIAAHRPLTTSELREALSVVPGDLVWRPEKFINDVISAFNCCGSLLIIDEEEQSVRLVHKSVEQFLLADYTDSENRKFTIDSAKKSMTDIIVTYLSYNIFETQLSTNTLPSIPIGSAPSKVIHSTLNSSRSAKSFALKLLKSRKTPDYDISKTLVEARNRFRSRPAEEFHFYAYAKSYWSQHSLQNSEHLNLVCKVLRRFLQKDMSQASKIYEIGDLVLFRAAEEGHEETVRQLVERRDIITNVYVEDQNGDTPLILAAENGHEAIVTLLFDQGGNGYHYSNALIAASAKGQEGVVTLLLSQDYTIFNERRNDSNDDALRAASANGHEALVALLLSRGADINARAWRGSDSVLKAAAENGHEAVVALLLDRGADINAKRQGPYGYDSALEAASKNGHTAVVKLLLATGKDNVDPRGDQGMTPLAWAACNGYAAVVKLLLATGKVSVDSRDNQGRTPFTWAAFKGHAAVVRLLLATGEVNVYSKDDLGMTPLAWASNNNHVDVVKLLLASGEVNVYSKDDLGMIPLECAIHNNHVDVVKLLLASGKINADSNNQGRTLFTWAAFKGNADVVKLLLATGKVEVDSKDDAGRTSLSLAAENGHADVVKLLLANEAYVDSKNEQHMTPLALAARNGYGAVVKLLLASKADVGSKDNLGVTPLAWAARNGHNAVVKLLKS